jgi:HNH endonuclease/AP2 domain
MHRKIRPIRIAGDEAFITLTKGFIAVIDVADVPLVEGFNWTALVRPHAVYAYRRLTVSGRSGPCVLLHRAILGIEDDRQGDHIDCDGLNNRRSNLRIATRSENQRNQRRSRANTSGIKGVTWDTGAQKWRAQIKSDIGNRYLGVFPNIEDAAKAYAAASEELHGEFGRLA